MGIEASAFALLCSTYKAFVSSKAIVRSPHKRFFVKKYATLKYQHGQMQKPQPTLEHTNFTHYKTKNVPILIYSYVQKNHRYLSHVKYSTFSLFCKRCCSCRLLWLW